MTSRDFVYWLQGYFEISNEKELSEEKTGIIKKHLDLVFYHEIDPSYTDNPQKQKEMNDLHDGKKKDKNDKIRLRC